MWQRDHKQNEKTTYGLDKIFANDDTNKELISKICKQFIQLLNIKHNNSIQKWIEDLDISPKKAYRWPICEHEKCSTSLNH